MAPTIDSERFPSLLSIDVARTLGERLLSRIPPIVAIARELAVEPTADPDDPEHLGMFEDQFRSTADAQRFFDWKVIEDFQQLVHDEFIDTTWPACPLHPRHPLDFDHDESTWRCPTSHKPIARLGELASRLP